MQRKRAVLREALLVLFGGVRIVHVLGEPLLHENHIGRVERLVVGTAVWHAACEALLAARPLAIAFRLLLRRRYS